MVSPEDGSSVNDRMKPDTAEPAPAAGIHYAFEQLAEARDYIGFYLRTRAELLKLTVRRFVVLAVLGVIAGIFALALLVTATVLLCRGIAEGLTHLFGGRVWAGDLVAGGGLLLVIGAAIYGTIFTLSHSWKKRTFSAFAEQKRQERRGSGGHEGP